MHQTGRSSKTLSSLASLPLMLALFLLLSCTTNATVVCEECRPLALQEGPGTFNDYCLGLSDGSLMLTGPSGVGMSLAPGYGSISIDVISRDACH